MTIIIPVWLMWTVGLVIGIPAALAILFFAVVGFMFASCWGRGLNW